MVNQQQTKLHDMHLQLEGTQSQLVSTVDEKASKIDTLEETILDLRESREDLVVENQQRLEDTQAQLHHAAEQLAKALEEADRAKTSSDQVRAAQEEKQTAQAESERLKASHADEIARLKADLDALATQHAQASTQAGSANGRIEQIETTHASLRAELQRHQDRRADLDHQVLSLRVEKEHAERECTTANADLAHYQQAATSAESSVVTELRAELAHLREAGVEAKKTANLALEEERARTVAAGETANLERERKQSVEGKIRTLEATLRNAEGDHKQLAEELGRTKGSLEQRIMESAILEHRWQAERLAHKAADDLATASQCAAQQLEASRADFERQVWTLREALTAAQQELANANDNAGVHQDRANKLAKELLEIKSARLTTVSSTSTTVSKARHCASASVPSVQSPSVLDGLRNQGLTMASTGLDSHSPSMMLRTKETEEIERLGKVIEAQKVIIEDQKEKIKFWARVTPSCHMIYPVLTEEQELKQQREVVRMLTADPNAGTPPKHRPSPRTAHGNKSIFVFDSPRDSPAAGSASSKPPFPSTFTARNLALPTSPSPLPMHPSQITNTSSRKGRRVTIEHDMDRLGGTQDLNYAERMLMRAETSKVNQAKALFDIPSSPTKSSSTPSHASATSLTPKQRRP